MEPHLPSEVMYRPKMGFAVPLARWFRGPLRQRVHDSVLGSTLAETGILDRSVLQELVDAHQSGARDYSAALWATLMFESFLRSVMGEAISLSDTSGMTVRVLHVLDHSVPLHSGYTFRTLAILQEQRRLGWDTIQLTSSKHYGASADVEEVDGLHFYRTRVADSIFRTIPVLDQAMVVLDTQRRLNQVIEITRPDLVHAHSPCLNGIAALNAGRAHGLPVVYEMRVRGTARPLTMVPRRREASGIARRGISKPGYQASGRSDDHMRRVASGHPDPRHSG